MTAAERVHGAAWIHGFFGRGGPFPSMREIEEETGDTATDDEQREIHALASAAVEEEPSAELAEREVLSVIRFADGSHLYAVQTADGADICDESELS